MARFIALIYNWWSLFVRLAEPGKHLEAITSRPLLLSAIAERTRHARQTTLRRGQFARQSRMGGERALSTSPASCASCSNLRSS